MDKGSINRIYLKIPLDRIGVVIGEGGEVKSEIEKRTETKIHIDSKTGEVIIEPSSEKCNPANILKAKDVITAIALGFSHERAFRLFEENQVLDVINLKEIIGSEREKLIRIKGRIIGEKGKTRRIIEEQTGAYVSVHENTVAIIGDYEEVRVAREAIEMLIKGMQHATVYRFLNRKHFELKKREISLWEERIELKEDT